MDDDLKTFLAVVDTGSFTVAARRVHRTQPAVSAAIARLEDQLGTRLLTRSARGSTPSAAGRALVPHARAVLAAIDDARRAVAEVAGLKSGEVRLGGGATVCAEVLPPHLAAFHQAHPGVLLRLREAENERLGDLVVRGAVDMAVLTDWPDRPATLLVEPLLVDTLALVASPSRRSDEVIAFRPGAAIRAALERGWPGAPIGMELGSVSAVVAHVEHGVGLALVSRRSVARQLADGRLVEQPHPSFPVQRTLALCHRGLDRLPPAAAALREWLLSAYPSPWTPS